MAPKAAEWHPSGQSALSSGEISAKPPLKPEEQELARKREEFLALEAELADRELRSANLRAELSVFERRYLHFVGSRYAELDEWKAQLAEKLAREQSDNERLQRNAREARSRAEDTKSTAGEKSGRAPRAFKASSEMKRLYREVARRIHPDLTSDQSDRAKRQQLMAEANEAYECGDNASLAKILTVYDHSPEAVEGEGAGAELIRVIRSVSQARARLDEIDAQMQALLRSDLYQLKSRVDEATANGHDVLRDMIEKIETQIVTVKQRLQNPSAVSN
jgi:hypothetical protein